MESVENLTVWRDRLRQASEQWTTMEEKNVAMICESILILADQVNAIGKLYLAQILEKQAQEK